MIELMTNFRRFIKERRKDPISGDKIKGANLSNDQASELIIKFLN